MVMREGNLDTLCQAFDFFLTDLTPKQKSSLDKFCGARQPAQTRKKTPKSGYIRIHKKTIAG